MLFELHPPRCDYCGGKQRLRIAAPRHGKPHGSCCPNPAPRVRPTVARLPLAASLLDEERRISRPLGQTSPSPAFAPPQRHANAPSQHAPSLVTFLKRRGARKGWRASELGGGEGHLGCDWLAAAVHPIYCYKRRDGSGGRQVRGWRRLRVVGLKVARERLPARAPSRLTSLA